MKDWYTAARAGLNPTFRQPIIGQTYKEYTMKDLYTQARAVHEIDSRLSELITTERLAYIKFEAERKLLAAEEADANYQGIVIKALEKLKAGSKPGWAVQAGVMALDREDNETLQKLVNAAHDDIGLVMALQECTGKKLGYLLGEF